MLVEAKQWHKHQVQDVGFYASIVVWDRFHDAVAIGQHRFAMTPAGKPEPAGVKGMQSGEVTVLAQLECVIQQRTGIYLAHVGHVEADTLGAPEAG